MHMATKKNNKKTNGNKTIAQNRRARHDYFLEDKFEAGIVLEGWEVKSMRDGRLQLNESYISMDRGEAWLNIQKELNNIKGENSKVEKARAQARAKKAGLLRQLRVLPEYKEMQAIGRILKQNAKLRNPLVDEDVLADMQERLGSKHKMGTTWYFKDHAVIYVNDR